MGDKRELNFKLLRLGQAIQAMQKVDDQLSPDQHDLLLKIDWAFWDVVNETIDPEGEVS